MDMQQHIAQQEIRHRLHEYCWGYDSNDMQLLGSVFTDNAICVVSIAHHDLSWGPWMGRAAIVKALSDIRNSQPDRRRHAIDTFIFDTLGEHHARARAYTTLYSYANGQPPHLVTLGEYSMSAIKTDHGWRIERLEDILDSPF